MIKPDKSSYAAMTVNERLVMAGLIDEWDRAVNARNRNEMIAVLKRVDVEGADMTADKVLANRAFYGFAD